MFGAGTHMFGADTAGARLSHKCFPALVSRLFDPIQSDCSSERRD